MDIHLPPYMVVGLVLSCIRSIPNVTEQIAWCFILRNWAQVETAIEYLLGFLVSTLLLSVFWPFWLFLKIASYEEERGT